MTLKGEGLVGHWRFSGDARDASPAGHQANVYGVEFGAEGPDRKVGGAARFNGKDAWLEIPDHPSLHFGSGDFSAAVWIHTEVYDDTIGDILSKFDPSARQGINFGVVSHAGVTSAQTNYRNVHFGIDAGRRIRVVLVEFQQVLI